MADGRVCYFLLPVFLPVLLSRSSLSFFALVLRSRSSLSFFSRSSLLVLLFSFFSTPLSCTLSPIAIRRLVASDGSMTFRSQVSLRVSGDCKLLGAWYGIAAIINYGDVFGCRGSGENKKRRVGGGRRCAVCDQPAEFPNRKTKLLFSQPKNETSSPHRTPPTCFSSTACRQPLKSHVPIPSQDDETK